MSAWEVRCETMQLHGLVEHHSPMVELDVAHGRLTLGVGTPNSMSGEQTTGALIRRYLDGDSVDWEVAYRWACDQQVLFARITAGTSREMMWSGDTVVRWSEDAAEAADAIFMGVGDKA